MVVVVVAVDFADPRKLHYLCSCFATIDLIK